VELQPVEAGGEHAHRVVANPHRVSPGPEEQPLQLAVAEQRLGAEVPGGAERTITRLEPALELSPLNPHKSLSDTSEQEKTITGVIVLIIVSPAPGPQYCAL